MDGFVDLVGPTDFATWGSNDFDVSLGRIVSGCSGADLGDGVATLPVPPSSACQTLIAASSPLAWVSSDDPPGYLICGALDTRVPCSQHELLRDALRTAHGDQQAAAFYDRYDDDPDNPPNDPHSPDADLNYTTLKTWLDEVTA